MLTLHKLTDLLCVLEVVKIEVAQSERKQRLDAVSERAVGEELRPEQHVRQLHGRHIKSTYNH